MRSLTIKAVILSTVIAFSGSSNAVGDGIPHRKVVDMLYQLAFANRAVYTREIVQRLAIEEAVITASEHFRTEKGLPLPAQMFRFSAEEMDSDNFWLALRALTPINMGNGPITPVEEAGLEYVNANPETAFYAKEKFAGRESFVGIYADVASLPACVSCHNGHPESPRHDFELGDVMGGVVVRLFVK